MPESDFHRFRDRMLQPSPEVHHLSGLNALGDLRGRIRMPRTDLKPELWPWFSFNYHEIRFSLGGRAMPLDNHPRFENRYVSVTAEPPEEGRSGTVPWGASRYFIHHRKTGAWVSHDHTAIARHRSEDRRFVFSAPRPGQQATRSSVTDGLNSQRRFTP